MFAPVPIIKGKLILRRFLRAGAVDAGHAINPMDIGVRKRLLFRRLVSTGRLVDAGGGKFYVDTKRI